MHKNILLATNGSESASQAEDYALQLCGSCGLTLTILHVIDEKLCHYGEVDTLAPLEARESFIAYVISEQEEAAEEISMLLKKKAEQYAVKYQYKLAQGDPIEVISKVADEENADLIIIGGKRSRRSRGFKSLSFTDKLSAQTERVILTVI